MVFKDDFNVTGFLDRLNIFSIGSSWGGFESLAKTVKSPTCHTDAGSQDSQNIVRLYIGLEHIADILEDLENALSTA